MLLSHAQLLWLCFVSECPVSGPAGCCRVWLVTAHYIYKLSRVCPLLWDTQSHSQKLSTTTTSSPLIQGERSCDTVIDDQCQSPVAGAASDWRRGAPATRPMPPPPPPATPLPSLARGEVTWMITMAWMMIILLIPLMLQKGRNLTLIRRTMRNVSRKLSYKMNKLRLRLRPWDWQIERRHQNDMMPWKLGHND